MKREEKSLDDKKSKDEGRKDEDEEEGYDELAKRIEKTHVTIERFPLAWVKSGVNIVEDDFVRFKQRKFILSL